MSINPALQTPMNSAPNNATASAATSSTTQQQNENLQVSSMPLPPMKFVEKYTDENVRKGIAPAPPPPISDSYNMFGNVFKEEDCIVSSLESQGIKRLYSAKDVDRKRELKKLNHSVLVNFLDLLDHLIKSPDSDKRVEKISDLNLLFIHMHHLINEFRPHQARETLRVMLHVQKKKRLQLADKFQEHLDKVQETIQNALDALPDQEESPSDLNMMVDNEDSNLGIFQGNAEDQMKNELSKQDEIMCNIVDNML